MMWTSDEPSLNGEWSLREMWRLYARTVDKDEYPEFAGWIWDMERSAVFHRHG